MINPQVQKQSTNCGKRLINYIRTFKNNYKSLLLIAVSLLFWLVGYFSTIPEKSRLSFGLLYCVANLAGLILVKKEKLKMLIGLGSLVLLVCYSLMVAKSPNEVPEYWVFEKIIFIIFAVISAASAVKIFHLHEYETVSVIIMIGCIAAALLIKFIPADLLPNLVRNRHRVCG